MLAEMTAVEVPWVYRQVRARIMHAVPAVERDGDSKRLIRIPRIWAASASLDYVNLLSPIRRCISADK